jgi:methylthioribose-1-phosphate isomerase
LIAESSEVNVISWSAGKIRVLDQSRLPAEEAYLDIDDCASLTEAIRELRVRGAPALGVAAAYGLALAAARRSSSNAAHRLVEMEEAAEMLRATRPTAVNLSWALKRVLAAARESKGATEMAANALSEARRIHQEEIEAGRAIGRLGADLVPASATVLTHCNTGALATAGFGTAFAVIRTAHEQGKGIHAFVDETRPLLQGARLTAWELQRLGIPFTIIVDSAAGDMMRRGRIDLVIVGADRVAANGDVANKVGTYSLAVLAKENGVSFYVAAPTSTVDLSVATGDDIPIEERSPEEVTTFGGTRIAPDGATAANPAFDVTPERYVSGIITERGIARPPYVQTLSQLAAADAPASRIGASKW